MNGTKAYLTCPNCKNKYPKYPLVVYCICGGKLVSPATVDSIKKSIKEMFGKEGLGMFSTMFPDG